MPSSPDSSWSVQIAQDLGRVEMRLGVFDGGSTTLTPIATGQLLGYSEGVKNGDLFWISQMTLHLGSLDHTSEDKEKRILLTPQQDRDFKAKSPMHITLGAWTHQGQVVPVSNQQNLETIQIQSIEVKGKSSYGLYLTSDIRLLSLSRKGELGLGVQLAYSPHNYPLHMSAALTWSEVLSPIAWAETGTTMAFGFSHLEISEQLSELSFQERSQEQLVEFTVNVPLTPSLATSLSWITLYGAH